MDESIEHQVQGQKDVPTLNQSVCIRVHEDPGCGMIFLKNIIVTSDYYGR